jgi:hypothetical protein
MKRIVLAAIGLSIAVSSFSQDSTNKNKPDTIRIGGMVIIKKGNQNDTTKNQISIGNHNRKNKNPNLQTNWWIVDLGFANWSDNSNYPAAQTIGFVSNEITKEQLKLRTGKSVNVNIWVFMQKMNIARHVLNLKYGLGMELNNYHFDEERLQLQEDPTRIVLNPEWNGFKKNKLAADYVTVPLMLNVNFTPKKKQSFGFSGGVSAGYLYSSRQKTKDGGNKEKTHDDFDLRKFKLSYIGELALGPVKLYGSYAIENVWDKGLDMTPYNFGLRLSRF